MTGEPVTPGEPDKPRVELAIGPVAHGGHCVARHEGRVVFVRHTLPGERVVADITEDGAQARFWRADAIEVLSASPHRVAPRCPASGPGGCGGCDWQHVDLDEQRRLKQAVVREQLQRLAGLDLEVTVEAVDGDDAGLGWRTRLRLAVGSDGRAGLRRSRSRQVVALDDCPLAHPSLGLSDVLGVAWPAGSEVLVVGGEGDDPTVQVVRDRATSTQRGPSRRVERAAGRLWRVTGAGFWQVHPGAADALVQAVTDALQPQPGESLADLYSGVGLFAGALAPVLGPSAEIVAVESDTAAVADARRNLHDLPQVRLVSGRVDRSLASSQVPPTVDLVVLDPPRSGAGRAVCAALAARRPRRIAYVACDPAALARDLRTFVEHGYVVSRVRAFDIFPMTHHIECVATLRRGDDDARMVADADAEAYRAEIS